MDKNPRLCISAGHGIGSRVKGKTDPGASMKGRDMSEAQFVLKFAKKLKADFDVVFSGRRKGFVMLRNGGLYYKADDAAYSNGCDVFIELHLNAGGGTGTEALFEDVKDKPLAIVLSDVVSKAAGIRNRGAKQNKGLAVLDIKPGMVQVLLELFFADNKNDIAAFEKNANAVELGIVNAILKHYGWRTVKGLPRKWSKARKLIYKAW